MKILQKVIGGLLFFDSHCMSYVQLQQTDDDERKLVIKERLRVLGDHRLGTSIRVHVYVFRSVRMQAYNWQRDETA